jgi:hypothetical protein
MSAQPERRTAAGWLFFYSPLRSTYYLSMIFLKNLYPPDHALTTLDIGRRPALPRKTTIASFGAPVRVATLSR